MAVVNKYALAHPGYALNYRPPAREARASAKNAFGQVTVTSGDNSTSRYFLAKIPSNARILKTSVLDHDALTGVTAASLGLMKGATVAATALINAQSFASAASKNGMLSVANANLGKAVWELAGLSADPGGEFDVIFTLGADAGATGLVNLSLQYVTL